MTTHWFEQPGHQEPLHSPPATADPDKPCPHLNFRADVGVGRREATEGGPVEGFMAEIRIGCADCGEPFRFIGVPAGLLAGQPCVSVDEMELRAPIRPASSDPDFGLGIPGYAVRYREAP